MQAMSAAPHPTIALLQNNSLTMVVQQEIERAILAGEFGPGAKLNEAALALRLGVSRGPVREAFRMLDEAGLVRTEKNRGVFVRNIPIDEAIEIFELRATMEELVGRRLAASMAPEQQQEIEALVHAMEESVKNRDSHSYHRVHANTERRVVGGHRTRQRRKRALRHRIRGDSRQTEQRRHARHVNDAAGTRL